MILSVRDPPVDLSSYSSLESRRMDLGNEMTAAPLPLTYSATLAHSLHHYDVIHIINDTEISS